MASGTDLPRAILFCLNGSLKGCTISPDADTLVIGTDPSCNVRIPPSDTVKVAPHQAVIRRKLHHFEIESSCADPILVNEVAAMSAVLEQNDLVRLGPEGPVLRFRFTEGRRVSKTFQQMVCDSRDYTSHNMPRRNTKFTTFARQLIREAVANSTRRFRAGFAIVGLVVAGLATALVVEIGRSAEREARLRSTINEGSERLRSAEQASAGLRAALNDEHRERKLMKEGADADKKLIEKLHERATETEKRLADFQGAPPPARSITEKYARGICLLAVGVSLYSEKRKEFLRFSLDPTTGMPRDTGGAVDREIGGKGDKTMIWSYGTGFVVSADGLVVTNHHVIDPWWNDEDVEKELVENGCRPVRETFVAFFPEMEDPIEVIRVACSADADVAVGRLATVDPGIAVMVLEPETYTPSRGSDAILLGYPLALEGIITKLETREREILRKLDLNGSFSLLKAIAKLKAIRSTLTTGVISNVMSDKLVYGATTQHGGSGGPLFATDGFVIGVNTAITNFSGANIGVRIQAARALLASGPLKDRTFDDLELRPDEIK